MILARHSLINGFNIIQLTEKREEKKRRKNWLSHTENYTFSVSFIPLSIYETKLIGFVYSDTRVVKKTN